MAAMSCHVCPAGCGGGGGPEPKKILVRPQTYVDMWEGDTQRDRNLDLVFLGCRHGNDAFATAKETL